MPTIEIALAANGPYFCGMLVTACSIAKSARKDCRLSFNILDGGIEDKDWEFFQRSTLRLNGNCSFNRIRISGEEFRGCLLWHGNHMTYARLLLPQLLPTVDYCIYCDVDFLWMRDVVELWNERREDIALISTWDGTPATWDVDGEWLVKNGFEFSPNDYFCAGLTFFNLKYFRKYGLQQRCFELLQMRPPFNDQTVLYIATKGHTKLVPEIWQRFSERLTPEEYENGVVIHYAGSVPWKPFKRLVHVMSDTQMLWHKMNAEIYGITTWRSLRRYFGTGHILWHRGLFWLLRTPIVRQLIRMVLCSAGKRGAWNMFECRSRRFG